MSEEISRFISPKVEEPSETSEHAIVPLKTTIDISADADALRAEMLEKKRQQNRGNYLRKKERLEALRNNQIKGANIILFNVNGKIRQIKVTNEAEYLKFIEDLLGTLKDNSLLTDFLIDA